MDLDGTGGAVGFCAPCLPHRYQWVGVLATRVQDGPQAIAFALMACERRVLPVELARTRRRKPDGLSSAGVAVIRG